jgi:CRP/FNR family transcriptional regulator
MENICHLCELKSKAATYLTEKEVDSQSNNCVQLRFKRGADIVREGNWSSNIAFLKSGIVKLHMKGPYFEQIMKVIKGPSYLSLPNTLGDKVNQYSITAVEESEICFVDIKVFKAFFTENPAFAYQIMIEQCQSELNTYRRCINRTQKQVRGKIAENILYFADTIYESDEYTLPLSREEFGNLVDATRESVSRVFSEFHEEGLIELNNKSIKILNRPMLELISEKG